MHPETTGIPLMRRRLTETPLPPEALELIADVLLAASARDANCPTYDEDQLARRSRRSSKMGLYQHTATGVQLAPGEPMSDASYGNGLPDDELTIWRMAESGVCIASIAERLHLTRQKVRRLIRNTLHHAATRPTPFQGLDEVYRAEVQRTGYHKPAHCTDVPCRKLGYCKYIARG